MYIINPNLPIHFTTTPFPLGSVQSLSRIQLFATPWTAARQASLAITNSRSLLKLMSTDSWVSPTPRYISRKNRNTNSKRYIHPSVHSSTIYNSQDMEVTQVPINRGIDKEDVCVYIYIYIYIHTHTHTWYIYIHTHHIYIYTPYLLYPFICQWTCRLLSCFGYCR